MSHGRMLAAGPRSVSRVAAWAYELNSWIDMRPLGLAHDFLEDRTEDATQEHINDQRVCARPPGVRRQLSQRGVASRIFDSWLCLSTSTTRPNASDPATTRRPLTREVLVIFGKGTAAQPGRGNVPFHEVSEHLNQALARVDRLELQAGGFEDGPPRHLGIHAPATSLELPRSTGCGR